MRVLALCVVFVLLGADAVAAANRQAGDNSGASRQDGMAASGDAIAGPSAGFSAHGDIRVRMTNRVGGSGEVGAVEREPGTAAITNVQGPTSVASGSTAGEQRSSLFVGLGVDGETSDVLADLFGAALRV